ncbi:GNAT family N-acetyltransferase [Eubacterium sp. 1001713B170207_170306_E7]|uniref:GNAT family N-acetyltransferase n=1 Tax=Eubacterium sp. 1001713B170207_170306_E7 TaxID=2787097 RepID=UPI00189B6038|nr:GNAT family N-acetyltransferase [Eubacterium sp. 1001713B170207_170306_E7]
MFANLTLRKIIAYGSDDYDQALALRDRLLRRPLGLSLYDEDLSGEKDDYHLGIFKGPALAAVLVLIPKDSATLQMRQVAVDTALQGQHLGAKLVAFAESFAATQGYTRMILNARQTAEAFYHKQGYATVSEPFMELGIGHVRMAKELRIGN